jgi:peptide/nickel transport system substrate-binding protein
LPQIIERWTGVHPSSPELQAMSRRQTLRWLLSGATVALAAACGPASPAPAPAPPTAAPPPPPAATAAAAPAAAGGAPTSPPAVATVAAAPQPATATQRRTGGTLRLAIPADISSMDGHTSSSILTMTVSNAFDRLVEYDAKAVPRPSLAESWDVSSDFKQVKLNLRKGVTWHNGREFTSDDVKFNLLRGQDPKVATGSYVNQAKWFGSMATPDKHTIVMTSDVSRPAVFDYLSVLNMVEPETASGPDVKSKAVGTGPFVFVEWVQGNHLNFVKNPNYWASGKPYVDRLVVSIIRDPAAMTTQLEAGAQDAIYGLNVNDFLRFKDDPRYVALLPLGQQSGLAIGMNTTIPPMDNKQVRQALNYALDRKRFVDTVFKNIVRPLSLPWDPNSLAYEASKENFYPFDLDKAKALMSGAGVQSAELDFLGSPNAPEAELIAQIYQSDLAKINVKLNVVRLEQAAWLDQVNNRKYRGFWSSNMAVGTGEPVSGLTRGRATDPNSNNQGYKDERYSALIDAAASEPDTAKRRQIYSQINDILLDESFVAVITNYPPKMVTTAKLHDVVMPTSTPSDFFLTDAWLEP